MFNVVIYEYAYRFLIHKKYQLWYRNSVHDSSYYYNIYRAGATFKLFLFELIANLETSIVKRMWVTSTLSQSNFRIIEIWALLQVKFSVFFPLFLLPVLPARHIYMLEKTKNGNSACLQIFNEFISQIVRHSTSYLLESLDSPSVLHL